MTKYIDTTEPKQEKGLRTIFTHTLDGVHGWTAAISEPEDFEIIKYLGKCEIDGDMFAAYHKDKICIYKGTKGIEFE